MTIERQEAEAGRGRRRTMGVLALLAVAVIAAIVFLAWYPASDVAVERITEPGGTARPAPKP